MNKILVIFFTFFISAERFDSRFYGFRSPQDGSFAQQIYTNDYLYPWMFYDSLQPFAVLPIRTNSVFDEFININKDYSSSKVYLK